MTSSFETIPRLLVYILRNFDNPSHVCGKIGGNWQKFSTEEIGEIVVKLVKKFRELGVGPQDKVGIMANPSPYWTFCDLATLCSGGVTVPMFSNIAPENLRFQIEQSKIKIMVVGSNEQYDVLKQFKDKIPNILSIEKLKEEDIETIPGIIANNKISSTDPLKALEEYASKINSGDLATLIYTSGSTGLPKGAELTHNNIISQVSGAKKRFPLDPASDKMITCLPLAHIFERTVVYYYLSTGCSLYYSPDVQKVGDDLREIHPTIITMVPRLLEKVFAKMQANADSATGLKKKLATSAIARAQEKNQEKPVTLLDRIYDKLVYSKMRTAMGGNLRMVISGSAPLSPELAKFFINIGVPIYEGYGLTEASPVLSANYPGKRKLGTVGVAFPDIELKIADDGEICARGPNIMLGYYENKEETEKVLNEEGWLHTGDLGHIDVEGFLKITGRKKELFKTATGKYVAPVPIEYSLAQNKLVDMAMIIAEGRKFASAIVFPDFENLENFKTDRGFQNLSDKEYLESEDARNFIHGVVDEVNAGLNHWEKVQKFIIAKTPLSIQDGGLTPTMKIRRHVILDYYKDEIEAIYQ